MPEGDEAASSSVDTLSRAFPNIFKKTSLPPHKLSFGGKSLDEAEAESDRRNLFSRAVRLPHLQKSANVSVSPIKVHVSPAEPLSVPVRVPSAVRITRRHTEQLAVMRKFTPPVQIPPPVPVVSRFPEPVYGRPRELDIMEELDSTTGAGLPNLPIAYNRIKLPPLQVTSATLGSTNITSSLSVINNPKPMNSISENSRGKGNLHIESRDKSSKYRVFFKCFFVVLFLSIPVVIFVVMMALSGGFSPFQAMSDSNSTVIPEPTTQMPSSTISH